MNFEMVSALSTETGSLEWLERACTVGSHEVLSFDLFDTLVTRNLGMPRDITLLLRMRHHSPHIITTRNSVERRLAANGKPVTIDALYAEMMGPGTGGWDAARIETELDLRLLRPRRLAVEFLRLARMQGKKIALTSDTLYSAAILARIAKSAGIDADDLIVSSADEGLTKAEGRLFERLTELTGCNAGSILHIGDNRATDVVNAQRYGISALHLPSPLDNYRAHRQHAGTLARSGAERTAAESVSIGIIKNRWFDQPAASAYGGDLVQFGYIAYGPLLLNICLWLIERAEAEGSRRIFCVSRDGFIVERVLAQMVAHQSLNVTPVYLMASRQFSTLISIRGKEDLAEALAGRRGTTRQRLAAILGSEADTKEFFPSDEDDGPIDQFVTTHGSTLLEHISGQRDAYLDYLKRNGIHEGGILFDIGYQGTTQHALEQLAACKLTGAYLMTFPEIRTILGDGATRVASFLDPASDRRAWGEFQRYRHLHEAMLSAPVGTFRGFDAQGDFLLGHMAYAGELEQVQRGIELFVADFLEAWPFDLREAHLSRSFALDHVHTHFAKPNDEADILMFSDIKFTDEFSGTTERIFVGGPSSELGTAQILWREGQARLELPYRNRVVELAKSALGKIVVEVTYLTTRKPALRRKLRRDPVMYFSDAPSPIIRQLAKLFY